MACCEFRVSERLISIWTWLFYGRKYICGVNDMLKSRFYPFRNGCNFWLFHNRIIISIKLNLDICHNTSVLLVITGGVDGFSSAYRQWYSVMCMWQAMHHFVSHIIIGISEKRNAHIGWIATQVHALNINGLKPSCLGLNIQANALELLQSCTKPSISWLLLRWLRVSSNHGIEYVE